MKIGTTSQIELGLGMGCTWVHISEGRNSYSIPNLNPSANPNLYPNSNFPFVFSYSRCSKVERLFRTPGKANFLSPSLRFCRTNLVRRKYYLNRRAIAVALAKRLRRTLFNIIRLNDYRTLYVFSTFLINVMGKRLYLTLYADLAVTYNFFAALPLDLLN